MKLHPVEHEIQVGQVQAPGRRKLYVGACAAGDYTGGPRTDPQRAWSDVARHVEKTAGPVTYEATLLIRVDARSQREAIVNLRRMLIRLATRRGFLSRSLAELRPITTKVGA